MDLSWDTFYIQISADLTMLDFSQNVDKASKSSGSKAAPHTTLFRPKAVACKMIGKWETGEVQKQFSTATVAHCSLKPEIATAEAKCRTPSDLSNVVVYHFRLGVEVHHNSRSCILDL